MKKILKSMLLVACMSGCVTAIAQEPADNGPFGTRMGMSKEELVKALNLHSDKGAQLEEFSIVTKKAITPSGFTNLYRYLFTPETGLCQIDAYSKTESNTSIFTINYDKVVNQLTLKYGKPTYLIDSIDPMYEKSNMFFAIENEKRFKTAGWTTAGNKPNGEGAVQLPNGLEGVHVNVIGAKMRGFMQINYSYSNSDQCIAIMDRAKAGGL